MDLKSCPICGQEIKKYETKYKLKKSTPAGGYRMTPFLIHHKCFIKMLWERENFDIIVPEETFEYLTIGEKLMDDWKYKKVWKLGTYVLKKMTQEEFDHYEALLFKNLAKKELIKK